MTHLMSLFLVPRKRASLDDTCCHQDQCDVIAGTLLLPIENIFEIYSNTPTDKGNVSKLKCKFILSCGENLTVWSQKYYFSIFFQQNSHCLGGVGCTKPKEVATETSFFINIGTHTNPNCACGMIDLIGISL